MPWRLAAAKDGAGAGLPAYGSDLRREFAFAGFTPGENSYLFFLPSSSCAFVAAAEQFLSVYLPRYFLPSLAALTHSPTCAACAADASSAPSDHIASRQIPTVLRPRIAPLPR